MADLDKRGRLVFIVWCCCCVLSYLPRCSAWKQRYFTEDSQLRDKRMVAERVITYHDVSALTCALRCTSQFPCGAYAYNSERRTCTFCALCRNLTLQDDTGFRFYVTTSKDTSQSSDDQTSLCLNVTADPDSCWKPCPEAMTHVSVGPCGVWGVTPQDIIMYRAGTYQNPRSLGTAWTTVYGRLVQLDVGTNVVWGVNKEDTLFEGKGISSASPAGMLWELTAPGRTWVTVSPGGSLWARDSTNGQLLFFNASWQGMDMEVMKMDAGLAGLWVLNTTGHLFHRLGTFGDTGSAGTEWREVGGQFRSVASGREVVVVVDLSGRVWVRTGLGLHTPTGLTWLRYPGSMAQVEVHQSEEGGALWGLNSAGQVFFSLFSG